MFVDADRYATSSHLSSMALIVTISETTYYIKNVQSPIAKRPEVVFRTLLFSFSCLEVCAMGFLIVKLIFVPVFHSIHRSMFHRWGSAVEPDVSMRSSPH